MRAAKSSWNQAPAQYELVTSPAVLEELAEGPVERTPKWLALIRELPLLPVEPAVEDIVRVYLEHKVMPTDPTGDALHLALASCHKCDFLVTWNCQHLANANKFGHIRRVNTKLQIGKVGKTQCCFPASRLTWEGGIGPVRGAGQ